jgi:hypothetical protein
VLVDFLSAASHWSFSFTVSGISVVAIAFCAALHSFIHRLNMEGAAHFLGDFASNAEAILKGAKKHVDGVIADLHAVGLETTAEDAQSLATYLTQMKTGDGVDDRMMRQEKLMSWLFKLPVEPKSAVGTTLERGIVQSLWDTLPHPAPSWAQYSGPQYHRADGSFNNPNAPQVGRAGEVYIRDVVSRSVDTAKAQGSIKHGKGLPSPEDIFEKLFRRRTPAEGGFKKHPCGISANMFYMATLVTHELFNTDITNRFRNKTTSYVDLSWLYGKFQSCLSVVATSTDSG